jgi:hypothetical protein
MLLQDFTATPMTVVSSPSSAPAVEGLLAAKLHDRGIPLVTVENAILLAAARRIFRPPDAATLQSVRSLYYVLPVIDELLAIRVGQDYFRYVRSKLDQALNNKQNA